MDALEVIQPNQLILPHDENFEMVPSLQLDSNEEYVCEFCQKPFKRKSYLVSHIRTHTGDKPFKCRFCPKAFASQSNLMRHLCIHTGERPYACRACNRGFIRRDQFIYHVCRANL